MNQHDEIYLIDLWRILRREWRWAVAALVVVLGLTFAFTRLAKPQWEATAWIQVGEIGPTPAGRDPKVEPFQRVIDRMKTRLFQDAVLRRAQVPLNSRAAQLYRGSLKPDPDPYANLIGVTIRAESAQQARTLAMATVSQLQTLHGDTHAAALDLTRARLQGLSEICARPPPTASSYSGSCRPGTGRLPPRQRRYWRACCSPTATPPFAP